MSERVLVIAAHPDDEVLGCGGTLARHAAEGDEVHLLFVADGETSRGMTAQPNRNYMAYAASKVLGARPPVFLDFSDQRLDQLALLDITKMIEANAAVVGPTIVYTHHAGDLNLDHALTARAALTALRPLPEGLVNAIYAFEVPSSTEWGVGFAPNHFVGINIEAKHEALRCYKAEMRGSPHPRSFDAVSALAEWRGASVGLHHAEAFMTLRRVVR